MEFMQTGKKYLGLGIAALILIITNNLQAFGVKYGDEFLKFGTGVRENSLGGTVIASSAPIVAAYWNPALLVHTQSPEVQIMHTEEFAGVVNNDHVFLTLPGQNQINFSAGFFRTGVDHIPATENALIEYGTENGRLDAGDRIDHSKISYFNASESAFFLAGSKTMRDNLAVGATFKTIHKNLYKNYAWGVGLDLGVFYEPVKNLRTGAVVRNLTTTFLYWNDGEKEIIKPSFVTSASYRFFMEGLNLEIMPMIGLDTDFEGRQNSTDLNVGDINVRARAGLEVQYKSLAIRTGRDDLGGIHLGCGLNTRYGKLDYGFAMGAGYAELDYSHRVALTFNINSIKELIKTR